MTARGGPSAVRAFGEGALLLQLEQRIDEDVAARASAIADAWEARGLGPAVPAYASVLLRFDPLATVPERAERAAAELLASPPAAETRAGRRIEVPTRYDGPDLAETAERSGMTADQLVAAHAGRDYRAYFLGFMPGFAYLGTLDPRIRAPRLATPRQRVPAGAVAVIDGQTAIYPLASPGGWRLIGRTDLAAFDPERDPPALIRAGDTVRFVAT
ncbi:MAG: 5-oxoprolinase subunit PxpB [Candidatus Limnocylindria bacterium]